MKVAAGSLGWDTVDTFETQAAYEASGDLAEATLYGQPFRIDGMEMLGIQSNVTGAPVGSLALQLSCSNPTINGTDNVPKASIMLWTEADTYAVSGAAVPMFDVPSTGARWGRLVWSKTSGTGAIATVCNAKGPH